MKKKKILLGALVATTAVATLAACTTGNKTTTGTDTSTTKTATATDTDTTVTDTKTDTDTTVTDTDTTVTDTDTTVTGDAPVDEDSYLISLHNDPTSDYENENVDEIEAKIETDVLGGKYVDFDITEHTPQDDYRSFAGWFYDKECTQPFDATADITKNLDLYAKWDSASQTVNYGVNVDNDAIAVGKLANEYVGKNVTITSGTEIRKRSKNYTAPDGSTKTFTNAIKMGGTSDTIKVVVPADTTMNIFYDDGSSTTDAYLTIYKDEALTSVYEDEVGKDGDAGSSAALLTQVSIEAGTYYIQRGAGTVDVFAIEFSCDVPLSATSGISVVNTGDNYVIEGNDYASDDISVQLNYENGSSAVLEKYTVDSSKVDKTTPGTYEVTVSYDVTETLYNKTISKTYTDTYDVVVYEVEDIVLGTYATYTAKNGLGTTCYINGSVLRIYAVGETIDSKYITVIANVKDVATGDENTLILPTAAYTNDSATSFDSANAGLKTITYTYETNGKTKTASYTVTVTDKTPCVDTETNTINVLVNAQYTGVDGDISLDGSVSRNTFSTINAAMDFLRLYVNQSNSTYAGMNIDFKIGAGYYNEKVEFDLPNMTVTGAGRDYKDVTAAGTTFDETKAHYDFTNTTGTVIEWDSLFGVEDASGYVQTTDSTATVAVRYSAENFSISGVTISNYINTVGKTYTNGEHRALALLVQADKFVMDNCCLYGYQDTVEFFKGRQIIQNTLITGATDFIFGSNNTTYFYNCEIRSVDSEDSKGASTLSGGYITAFKGCASGESDYVEYGAIFDGCNFTCDGNVLQIGGLDKDGNVATSGNTAIARPWGKYAKVAVVNSTLGGHISINTALKEDGSILGQNARYVQMSGNLPTADTTKFVEYNNTGDGAITDATVAATIVGLTLITDSTEGAKYSTIETIFATENGKVKYDEVWLGTKSFDASIVIKNGDEIVGTISYYSGALLSDKLEEIKALFTIADGFELKLYSDAALTTAITDTTELVAGENVIYGAVVAKAASVSYTYNVTAETNAGFTVTDSGNGKSATCTSTAVGTDLAVAGDISYPRLMVSADGAADNITASIYKSTSVTMSIIGGTNGTGNATGVTVQALDADGNVVDSIELIDAGGKTIKYLATSEGETEFTLTSTGADITTVKIFPNQKQKNTNKGYGFFNINIEATINAKGVITDSTTYTFGTSGNLADLSVNGSTATSADGLLTIDATSGKLTPNNASYHQFNEGAKVTFTVLPGATVTVTQYQPGKATVNGTTSDTKVITITTTDVTTVEIVATANDYLEKIEITYNK